MSLSSTVSKILSFISQNLGYMTLNPSLLEVVYHACTGTPLYQTAHDTLKCKTSPLKIVIGAKFKNGLRDPDQAREGIVW